MKVVFKERDVETGKMVAVASLEWDGSGFSMDGDENVIENVFMEPIVGKNDQMVNAVDNPEEFLEALPMQYHNYALMAEIV